MGKFIPQMEPVITDADRIAVGAYLASGGWLTEFEKTRMFERRIAEFTGARFCATAPNGTLALFLALAACEVGPGHEVIVPDLTMAATASAVILAGAKVVFADIDPQSLCLDLSAAERLFSPRTRAVMFVSLNGRAPAGLPEFVARCRARGIRVIEDAAQSLGSFSTGRHLGTLGDCGCFSFSSQKIVTTGQGGAVVTDDEGLAGRMKLLRDFGRLEGGSDRYLEVGWNLKFTDLQAVIGLEQMKRLPELVSRKRAMFAAYRRGLSGIPSIVVPDTDLESVTPWFMDVLVGNARRERLMDHLRQQGIGSRPIYPALHTAPAFVQNASCPVAEDVSGRGLWLPSSLRLKDEEIAFICESIRGFLFLEAA